MTSAPNAQAIRDALRPVAALVARPTARRDVA
jgi:hypothetical protein